MSLVLSSSKPKLINQTPLCSFRSSKSYLWGLVRDRLHTLSTTSSLSVLDAACHSLITRHIFPPSWNYFGLDISRSRLTSAFPKKNSKDVLLLADLTKPFPPSLKFDVVVSLNTLSHLPLDSQTLALKNLVSCCDNFSHLIVNASVDSNLSDITALLLSNFETVHPVYFNSFQSCKDEESGLVNSDNVKQLIVDNEESLPNDASLHKAVLFLCSRGAHSICPSENPISSLFNPSKIHVLNTIPSVNVVKFQSDLDVLNHLRKNCKNYFVVVSSRLFHSPHFKDYLSSLDQSSIPYSVLDDSVVPPSDGITTFCLGLEAEWTQDEALDRVFLNRLRELPGVKISLCFVNKRFNSALSPSLIFSDY